MENNYKLKGCFRKKEKTFRYLSKFQHTPPFLPHSWQFSILTKNSGIYPVCLPVSLCQFGQILFLVNVNILDGKNNQIHIRLSIIKTQCMSRFKETYPPKGIGNTLHLAYVIWMDIKNFTFELTGSWNEPRMDQEWDPDWSLTINLTSFNEDSRWIDIYIHLTPHLFIYVVQIR